VLHNKSFRRIVGLIALIAMAVAVLVGVFAGIAQAAPPPIHLDVRSAILIDYATGQVLHEQDADVLIPPASLTKLMTLHLAYQRIAQGGMTREDRVNITPDAWAAKMPGSSVMFLEPGQNVTVGEIMKGIAVPSGNDASIAMAQHMAGTVDAFVSMMNKEAQDMGFEQMTYADPAGLSPRNRSTAREFAEFARQYVRLNADALAELHSVKEYTYPLPQNNPQNTTAVTQDNRNGLLWTFEGVDGLKTGFIDESGYNIALTAQRGDMRLVAVILGAPGRNPAEGTANREQAGAALLRWGFQNFVTVTPPVPTIPPVRVWKGEGNEVTLEPESPITLTVEHGQENALTTTVQQEASVSAPVQKGQKLGELVYAADGVELARVPLVAAEEVEAGGFFKRLWDSLRLMVTGWLNKG
jgi:D-alanyl-D-alanine carboxypeptidase (penicillin-binding protein 5/6)